jgi:hypothetical protein
MEFITYCTSEPDATSNTLAEASPDAVRICLLSGLKLIWVTESSHFVVVVVVVFSHIYA